MTATGKMKAAWAVVVILDGPKTRPFRRYTTLDLAMAAAEGEPEMADAPDYLVIAPHTVMGSLEPVELDSLCDLAKVKDDLTVAQRQEAVKEWLGKTEPLYDALSGEATKPIPAAETQVKTPKSATKSAPKSEDEMATKKKGATAPKAKKGAAPAKKKAAAKPAAAKKEKGDGLGREGSVTRFLCEGIIAKEDDKKLLEKARKKFPDRKIGDNYVSWYRTRLKKQGLVK